MNPIQKAREDKGLSRSALAMLAGVSSSLVSQAERGMVSSPGPAILRAFERLGYDRAQLLEAYAAWREAKAQECLATALAASQ